MVGDADVVVVSCVQASCTDANNNVIPCGPSVGGNFTITFSTPSGADVVPESCLDSGSLCVVGLSQYYPLGRTYEVFAGSSPAFIEVDVEACVGNPVVYACSASGVSNCSDPTNPSVSADACVCACVRL